ncbi:MAG: hypothetical protein ABR905_17885 [Terracidiphilus sp.]|jgi:hypothetical protein
MEDGIEDEQLPEPPTQTTEATAEGNVSGMMPAPDHGHGHEHKTGIPWLDGIIAVSVIFISVLSLAVSIEHGRTMAKMVEQNQKLIAASTMPLLNIGNDMGSPTGQPQMRVVITNGGVGPAVIDRFELSYKGKVYPTKDAFLRACCADAYLKSMKDGKTKTYYSTISSRILPAREQFDILTIEPDKAGMDLYNSVYRVMHTDDMSFHACYCSVLDECWETRFDQQRPQAVNECKVVPGEKLW